MKTELVQVQLVSIFILEFSDFNYFISVSKIYGWNQIAFQIVITIKDPDPQGTLILVVEELDNRWERQSLVSIKISILLPIVLAMLLAV